MFGLFMALGTGCSEPEPSVESPTDVVADSPSTETGSTSVPTAPVDTDTTVPAPEPCDASPEVLEVGVGGKDAPYLPLTGVEPVSAVFGGQGAWHVETSARIHMGGLDGATPPVRFDVTAWFVDSGDVLVGPAGLPAYVALASWDPVGCDGEVFGHRAVVDGMPDGVSHTAWVCAHDGERLQIEVEVTPLDGGEASVGVGIGVLTLDATALAQCAEL